MFYHSQTTYIHPIILNMAISGILKEKCHKEPSSSIYKSQGVKKLEIKLRVQLFICTIMKPIHMNRSNVFHIDEIIQASYLYN